ncbi:hypothetical protein QFC20_002061 [Naganishia adeliensis]|uniref:Uncharacterized protein n=1 Tax=Naganishia adeliensis TaxID=92952 RepID=A0ACC2WN54_9TREE|nr:hypothetical protein QFC20_002061 [Naganishia adeliensis]
MLVRTRLPHAAISLSRVHRLPAARPFSLSVLGSAFNSSPRSSLSRFSPALQLASSRAYSSTPLKGEEAPVPSQEPILAVNTSDAVSSASATANDAVNSVSSTASNVVESVTTAASHVVDKTNILHASSTPPTQAQIAHDILPQPPADALTPSIEQLIAQNPDNIADVINSTEAIHAAMRVGDMHLMGLTHGMFNFAGWLRDALEIIHVNAGLPWWGTIALAAGVMRLALFPLVARMHGNNARMQVIAPQQQVIMTKIQDASKRGDKGAQMIYSQELRKLWEKNNCSPFRTMLLPMVQVPLFMTFFFAIRGMTSLPVPQLKEGGVLWFTDLVAADPYYILPTTSMLLTLAVLEVGADGTSHSTSKSQAHLRNGMRIATIAAIPFIAYMPAGLTFYWTFSNSLTLLQAGLIKNETVKRYLGILKPPPQPRLKGVEIEKPPTMLDSLKALRDTITDRWTRAKENAEAHQRSKASGAKPAPKARLASLEQSEIIREAAPAFSAVAESSTPVAEVSGGEPVVAASTPEPVAASPKKAAAPVVRKLSPAQAEKEARVAAARLRRQRK